MTAPPPGGAPGIPPRARTWGAAAAAATVVSLLVATQNYLTLAAVGRPVDWLDLFLLELPVWFSWAALLPVIVWLTRRFPPAGPVRGRNGLVHLGAGLGLTFASIVVVTAVRWPYQDLPDGVRFWPLVRRTYIQVFALFLIVYGAFVAGVMAWRYQRDAQVRALRESRLAARLSAARLDVLRAQIHPHFLFNTLHAVSALMERDVPTARRMMSRLSELLRLTLDDEGHEVTLREELDFLDRYAEIQRLRFQDRLQIDIRAADDVLGVRVPSFILQPLVENAIRHGVARRAGPGRVSVRACRDDASLRLEVRDDGPGFPVGFLEREDTGGLGLANVRARLDQLYGEAYEMRLENPADGGALVRLRLPLEPAAEEMP